MNLVDSSAWLEYFADGMQADFFAAAVENTVELIVPTVCLFEVFKSVAGQREGQVVELTSPIALSATSLSKQLHIPMASSIVLATARILGADLWTCDDALKDIEGVRHPGA
jgi:predicted nucleic acid-binding protein